MKYLILVLALATLCCHDNCKYESTSCQGDNVVLCNSENDWQVVEDCTNVQPGLWECCVNAFEYEGEWLTSCVPLDTCEVDGGVE